MIQERGIWFPADIPPKKMAFSFRHVAALEWAIAHCRQKRTVVQAGGNIGLWPLRLAREFQRVITFEPEPITLACLRRNVPASVDVLPMALGDRDGLCGIDRKSVGSHKTVPGGTTVDMTRVDTLNLQDLDLLQLDIEGYEWFALAGAAHTIARCRPLIQVELRNHGARFGHGDADVVSLLRSYGYREVSRQQGVDAVFACGGVA